MTRIEPTTFAEIEARADAATSGPWGWRGNVDTHNIHLRCINGSDGVGYPDVLRCHRSGMQGGKPVFNLPRDRGLINVRTEDLVVYQVCRDATSRSDPRVYRGDIVGIRHPDAEFIAHSRNDVEWLLARVRDLERTVECLQNERSGLLAAVPTP